MKLLNKMTKEFQIVSVIANLENKLIEAALKRPDLDYSEQEAILEILRDYHLLCLEVIEENRIMRQMYETVVKKHTFTSDILEVLKKDNKKLIKEVEQLKQNIP